MTIAVSMEVARFKEIVFMMFESELFLVSCILGLDLCGKVWVLNYLNDEFRS